MSTDSNTHIINVVGAAIISDGRVLCAQRGPGRSLAGYWEFPGGKIEDGESAEQALRREIHEELRCRIAVGHLLTTTIHTYDFATIRLSVFLCHLEDQTPTRTEHSTLSWMTPAQMRALSWAPADQDAARLIITGQAGIDCGVNTTDTTDTTESSLVEALMSGFIRRNDKANDELEPALIANQDGRTMKRALSKELETSDGFDMSVAFISQSALQSLKQSFLDFSSRRTTSGRIITSTFNYFNSPRVFQELLKLQETASIDVRIWEPQGATGLDHGFPFHPKGYIFVREHNGSPMISTYVGSSNLTSNALSSNKEWNLKVNATGHSSMAVQLRSEIDAQLADSVPLTRQWVDDYTRLYSTHAPIIESRPAPTRGGTGQATPNSMQIEALRNLKDLRHRGESKAIVISATGTGKTYLAAFDVRQYAPRHALYLVHQEQILDKAKETFHKVLGGDGKDLGMLTGRAHDADPRNKVLFSTVQTMSRPETLSSFAPDTFDYILIDEVHHASAETYRRILDHFHPHFLLGMTATPERTDGENIFDLFGNNVAYEIRLRQALDAGMLCNFHYYGVHDCIGSTSDTTQDPTFNRQQEMAATLSALTADERVRYIIDKLDIYGQAGVPVRGIVFCSSVEEARSLSQAFNRHINKASGKHFRTMFLCGSSSQEERSRGIRELDSGDLDYIFTVDLFNEGIDIPHVNQIVMLRQTQSSIIFTQQLGRGLRRASGKDSVTVIDFIGNYANNYLIPLALYGNTGDRDKARKNMQTDTIAGSSISFDPIARERVLQSLDNADLSDMRALSEQYRQIRYEINRIPLLMDIATRDPSLVATMAFKSKNYLAFVRSREASLSHRKGSPSFAFELNATTPEQDGALTMLTSVVLKGLRPHESLVLARLCGILDSPEHSVTTIDDISDDPSIPWEDRRISKSNLTDDLKELFPLSDRSPRQIDSAFRSLDLSYFIANNQDRFGATPLVTSAEDGTHRLSPKLSQWLSDNATFTKFFMDAIRASLINAHILQDHLPSTSITRCGFIYGEKYSVFDVMRMCGWKAEQIPQNVGGYRFDQETSTMPIFIKYESSQYEDRFLDTKRITWVSKNGRTLRSPEYTWLLHDAHDTDLWSASHTVPVFIRRKKEARETTYYFVGMVRSVTDLHETLNTDSTGKTSKVVVSTLTLERPVTPDLFEHLTGSPTI